MICSLCPHKCAVNREERMGYCSSPDQIRIARAALHFWEEPCISGEKGSGTIFFSGCTMRCIFCQNKEISSGESGIVISDDRLVDITLELQEKGANNINFVTPDHYAYRINRVVKEAKKRGLCIPIVMNTGGYLGEEAYELLKEVADIWLTDYKYDSEDIAKKYSLVSGYPEIAFKRLKQMVQDIGMPVFREDQLLEKGVIVRVLLLPGCVADAKRIVKKVYSSFGNNVILSLMNQYTPPRKRIESYPNLNRRVSEKEYSSLIDYALSLGVEEAYIQEKGTAEESYIPPFDYTGVLPN